MTHAVILSMMVMLQVYNINSNGYMYIKQQIDSDRIVHYYGTETKSYR